MKKLFAIGLIMSSPLTFAKEFNPNLLVGTWECEAKFYMLQGSLVGIEKSRMTFYTNGNYHSTSQTKQKIDG